MQHSKERLTWSQKLTFSQLGLPLKIQQKSYCFCYCGYRLSIYFPKVRLGSHRSPREKPFGTADARISIGWTILLSIIRLGQSTEDSKQKISEKQN